MTDLKGKVAIVTGGATGIGRGIARCLARDGATIVICDWNLEGGRKVVAELESSGCKGLAIKADISRQDEVEHMVAATIRAFGRADILVNDAAFSHSPRKAFWETAVADWQPEVDMTFMGAIFCCRAVVPHMIEQKSGRIISITSAAGKEGRIYRAMYSACKAAVAGFSRALAKELAPYGVTVNCVAPGLTRTDRLARGIQEAPELEAEYRGMNPMGLIGEPEDIGNMVAYLASDRARFVTGQDFGVDGGQRM